MLNRWFCYAASIQPTLSNTDPMARHSAISHLPVKAIPNFHHPRKSRTYDTSNKRIRVTK